MAKKKTDPPKPTGRPHTFNEDTAIAICEHLITGSSLIDICNMDGMPSTTTVYRWREENDLFRDRYARARELQAETMADMVVAIPMNAKAEDDVQLVRLKMDALKWRAGKLRPNTYGEAPLMRGRLARLEEEEYIAKIKDVTPKDEEGQKAPRDPKQIARIINYMLMKSKTIEHKEKDE